MLINPCAVFCVREADRDHTLRGRLGERRQVHGGLPQRQGRGGASHRAFEGAPPPR